MVTMIAMAAKRMSPAFCRILSRPRLPPAQPIQRRLLSQADLANLEAHFRGGAMPRIRVISPIIWACSVSALIYLGCAGFSVYRDVADYKKRHRSTKTPTLAQVDSDAGWSWAPSKRESEMGPIPLWGNLTPIGKDVYSLIAINAGILGAGRIMPLLTMGLAHTPIIPRNSTLFTSTFAHANVLHWAFNAYATVMFGLQVGEGRTFAGSGSHFLSFYLAAGTLSGLGSHLWEALPWRNTFGRAIPSLGASGAVMAIVGSWLMANPTGKIGIMFIPYSWQAQDFLWGLVAFESLGALGALKFLRLSINHASHLSGLGIGAIYTVYDGKKHVWEPARNIAFDILCRTKLV